METQEQKVAEPDKSGQPLWQWMLLGLGILLIANWPYRYEFFTTYGSVLPDPEYTGGTRPPAQPMIGGFPFTFLVHYPETSIQPVAASQFRIQYLLINVGLVVLAVATLRFYLRVRRSGASANRYSLTIMDLFLVAAIGACFFAWWQHSATKQQAREELVQQIRSGGGEVYQAVWSPSWLHRWLPPWLRQPYIRQTRIFSLDRRGFAQLCASPYLDTVRMQNYVPNKKKLRRLLRDNTHLTDLQIPSPQFEENLMQAVASCTRLRQLDIAHSNITIDLLAVLESSKNLKGLKIESTNLDLAQLKTLTWMRELESLTLGPSEKLGSQSFQIAGWPNLTHLMVARPQSDANTTPMELRVVNVPSLQKLGLAQSQKFDLTVQNAPQLQLIRSGDPPISVHSAKTLPSAPWLQRIDMDGIPMMEKFAFYCADTRQLKIRNAPKLQTIALRTSIIGPNQKRNAKKLDPDVATALIEGLAGMESLNAIDLSGIPLRRVDLSPLTRNTGIQRLNLAWTLSTPKQWKTLENLKSLTHLELSDDKVDQDSLARILDSYPNLERLKLNSDPTPYEFAGPRNSNRPSLATKILTSPLSAQIVDHRSLRSIEMADEVWLGLDGISIINSPQFETNLHLGSPRELQIAGAPAIQSIIIRGPVAQNARIEGLRGLHTFAAGGQYLTDPLISTLADCTNLTTLTLAYPAITEDGLRSLSTLSSLRSLHLPGTPLDDSIVDAWEGFDSLVELNVSDTKVTGASLPRLLAGSGLARLNLDRTNVKPADLHILAERGQLVHLSLVGVGIDAKTLKPILQRGFLQTLDLSDSEITEEILSAVADHGSGLQILGLRNCKLMPEKFSQIVARNPNLVFDVSVGSLPIRATTDLMERRRLQTFADWRLAKAANTVRSGMLFVGPFGVPDPAAKIDIDMFAEAAAANSQIHASADNEQD